MSEDDFLLIYLYCYLIGNVIKNIRLNFWVGN